MTNLHADIDSLSEKLRLAHSALSRLSQGFYKMPGGLPVLERYRACLTLKEGQGLQCDIEIAGQMRDDISRHDELSHADLMGAAEETLRQVFDILRRLPVLAGPSLSIRFEYALIGGRDIANQGHVLAIDHMRLPCKSGDDNERLLKIVAIIKKLAAIPGDPAQTRAFFIDPRTQLFGPCSLPVPCAASAVMKYAILQNPGLLERLDDPCHLPDVAEVVAPDRLARELRALKAGRTQ